MAAFFVLALVGSILASFVGLMEWFWPGTTVLLVILCITLLIMLLTRRDRWLILGLVAIVLFMILDLTGVTNWFIVPERDGNQSTTAAADCLNAEQKAFVISTTDPLITQDIRAKAATMKDDDSLCATARAILTRIMAAPAQDVPVATATAEAAEPTETAKPTREPAETQEITGCEPIHHYILNDPAEVSSSGDVIWITFMWNGEEYKALLDTNSVPGGRFVVPSSLDGAEVREYRTDCGVQAIAELGHGTWAPQEIIDEVFAPVGS